MWKLIAFFSVLAACTAFDCPNGKMEVSPVGCFKRSPSVFKTEIVNNRDKTRHSYIGHDIDWNDFHSSIQKLACACLEKAKKEGYIAIAIGFYGECHGAKDKEAYENLIMDKDAGSNECINAVYKKCQANEHCVGKAHAEYIYTMPSAAPEVIDGGYSKWSEYTQCSATCGQGIQSRERTCTNPVPENGGKNCEELGESSEAKECKIKECPINGGYTEWSVFSECSKSCGGGTKKRTRSCSNPEPKFGGKDCHGENEQVIICGTDPCPVNGGFGSWSSYGQCSKTCGFGVQLRSRKCDSPKPAYGGLDCSGSRTESRTCNAKPCPVNGGFGSWSSYGQCSKTCGGGIQSRTRKCDSPKPANGGFDCSGSRTESRTCNTNGCPVNGGWTSWGSYGSCNKNCGGGLKYRTRSCTNPSPKNGGNKCSGVSSQSANCNTQPCLSPATCYYYYTSFNKEYKGRPVYLDRHTLHCPTGYVMNDIRLQRNSGHTQIRYRYKCCKSQLTCSDSKKTNGRSYNGGGEGNTVYLDRQSVDCSNKAISSLKLDRSGSYWNYKYDCCRVTYTKASISCYHSSTPFNDDGDGKVFYLDRHHIACSTNYFITYLRLNRNSSHNKYRYSYKCCKINTPAVTN